MYVLVVGQSEVVYQGGCTRVGMGPGGYRGGLYRVLPTQPPCCSRSKPDSEAGPRKALQGPGVGWSGAADVRWAGRLQNPPYGPGRSLWALPGSGPSECPPRAHRARINLILLKVSQNAEVSPKYVNKACHSPHSQNGSQKVAS